MLNLTKTVLNKPILIVGAGSIGERHIRNLWQLGFNNLFVFRQRNLPFRDIADAKINVITDWAVIEEIKPYAAFITSPTSLHLQQAIKCAQLGAHVFIEKPLSHNLEGIDQLKYVVQEAGIYIRIGYMMRYHPLIIRLKEIIDNKVLGELLSFSSKWGEYLPNWHPWEDYRFSYAAKQELGGGSALTLSHDIDLVNWICSSNVVKFATFKNYKSKLEVDVESGADILLKFENGITGSLNLNFYEKVNERFLNLVFDEGSINFNYYLSKLTIKKINITEYIELKDFDRNNLFISQLYDFFQKINNYKISDSINQIEESEIIIKICNAN